MTSNAISRPACILGLGLIGGSIMKDLQAARHPTFGYNRSSSAARSAQKEGFEVSANLEPTLERAEKENALIIIAVPMTAVPEILDAVNTLAPSCGFTDVTSVKTAVYQEVLKRGMQDRYVGSHPMAGTTESGWDAAMQGLFKNAAWVISFDQLTSDQAVPKSWETLWQDVASIGSLLGCEVIPARVAPHDNAVARISHLTHILAETLAIVGDNGGALALSLASNSFRDSTRVAGTDPSLVRAMCENNAPALNTALDEALEILHQTREHLATEQPNIDQLATLGYRSRLRYEARSGHQRKKPKNPVTPVPISPRPVLRIHPGSPNWDKQLLDAETLGARIEVF